MAPPVFRNFDHKIALAPQIGSSKSKIALKGMEGGSVGRCNSRQPYLISIPFDVQKGFRNGWPSIEKHWSQNRSGPSNWPKIGPKCPKFYQNRYHLIMSADIPNWISIEPKMCLLYSKLKKNDSMPFPLEIKLLRAHFRGPASPGAAQRRGRPQG